MLRFLLISFCLGFGLTGNAQDLLSGAEYNQHLGDSLYAAGAYDDARIAYKTALFSTKHDAVLNYKLAKTFLQLKEVEAAKRHLRRASRIGHHRSDLMLDSLMGRSNDSPEKEVFEKDLEKYIEATEQE